MKNARLTKIMNELKSKNLHGQYYNLLNDAHIDKTATLKWLTSPSLKRATEATICAIRNKPSQQTTFGGISSRLRLAKEKIYHVISGCIALAPKSIYNDTITSVNTYTSFFCWIEALLTTKFASTTTNREH